MEHSEKCQRHRAKVMRLAASGCVSHVAAEKRIKGQMEGRIGAKWTGRYNKRSGETREVKLSEK